MHIYIFESLKLEDLWIGAFAVVQSPSHVRLCDPMDCTTQASLSLTVSWSLPKFMSIVLVMPSQRIQPESRGLTVI